MMIGKTEELSVPYGSDTKERIVRFPPGAVGGSFRLY